jgi:hypothetical protein
MMTSKDKSSSTPLWVLSIHAAARIEQRKIRHDWIDRAIRHPDQTEPDPDDPELTLVYKQIGEKGF